MTEAFPEVKKGQTYASARWKGDRKVTDVVAAVIDGKRGTRVEYLNLQSGRTGWSTLPAFVAHASLKEPEAS